MASLLVDYGTDEGQTAKVTDRIVGASIHVSKHQPAVVEFVEANRDALATIPTAFFQMSMSSGTEGGTEQAAGYVEEFIETTGWYPDRIGLFGGALRFSEFGFLKRFMAKQVANRQLPGLDTSQDAEFTDWNAVADFVNDFGAFVEGRLGLTAPATSAQSDAE